MDEILEKYQNDPELGPIVSNLSEPDLPTVLKGYHNLKGHLGKAVFVKDPTNVEERQKAQARAYELGIFDKPNIPESPDKYDLTRPEGIPEAAWKDDVVSEFKQLAHKHGLSQEAIKELADFDAKRFTGMSQVIKVDREQAEAALKQEWEAKGKSYEDVLELGGRAIKQLFSEEEFQMLDKAGIGDHPKFLSALAKVGEAFESDAGITSGAAPSKGGQDAEAEALDITRNEANPKFKQYWSGDKQVVDYVNSLWQKAKPGMIDL